MLAAQARSEALAVTRPGAPRPGALPRKQVRYRVHYRLYPTARIALGGLVVCLVLLLYVAERTALVDLNYRLGEQKKALSIALVDNERLKLEAARLASLERIEREATVKLGMVRPEQTRYVAVAGPVGASVARGATVKNEEGGLSSRIKSLWSAFARAAASGGAGQ